MSTTISNKLGINFGNVTCNIGNLDALSFDQIANRDDIDSLERDFTKRLEFSEERLAEKYLPTELKNDFKVVARKQEKSPLRYLLQPISPDAYKKFPLSIDLQIKFPNKESADRFLETGGIDGCIRKADETGLPVAIPNVYKVAERLGNHDNPFPIFADGDSTLYIQPRPLPAAEEYIIELCGGEETVRLETKLRLLNYQDDSTVLTNRESSSEKYDITVTLPGKQRVFSEDHQKPAQVRIAITTRGEYSHNLDAVETILKYKYCTTSDDAKLCLFKKAQPEHKVILVSPSADRTPENHTKLRRRLELIRKLKYISMVKNVSFEYDDEELFRDGVKIDYIFKECQGEGMEVSKGITVDTQPLTQEAKQTLESVPNGTLVIDDIKELKILGQKVKILPTRLVLQRCHVSIEENDGQTIAKITSQKAEFISKIKNITQTS